MHLIKAMYAGRRFFRNAAPFLDDLVPAKRIVALNFEQQIFDDLLFLVRGFGLRPIAAFLQLVAFVDEQRGVAPIIDHQLGAFAVGMRNRLISAPPIIFKTLAFPREDGDA